MARQLFLSKNFNVPGAAGYDGYVKAGGYQALKKALAMKPLDIVETVKAANLRGRGGAGFAAGVKWGFLPKGYEGPKYLAVNADEGEPGTFKDRQIMERDPHQMLEGILITCYALGLNSAYIYIRGEFLKSIRVVQAAVDELYAQKLLGAKMAGTDFSLDITVHSGAGAYICGEETGLLSSLEGLKGFPRIKPPFPAVKGLFGCPTIINNVETLSCVPHILVHGASAWAALGCEKNGGTKLFCVSGQVARPGTYELPHTVTLRQVVFETAGGPLPGRKIKAIIPGGSSAPVLAEAEWDVRMDFESVAKAGSMLGSAAVIVMDDSASMVRALENLTHFYSHESCGQCTPCREGTAWIQKIMVRLVNGGGKVSDLDLMLEICDNMVGRTICVLADACAGPVTSFIRKFRPEFEEYIRSGKRLSLTGYQEEARRSFKPPVPTRRHPGI